jgi:hypothetical protein
VGNKCFRVTPVDYQPGSLDQQSVCLPVSIDADFAGGVGKAAPERLHINGSLEHDENMRAVVRVEHLAIRAEVLRTERTAVPFTDDTPHMPVAERKGMCEVTEITCFDAG